MDWLCENVLAEALTPCHWSNASSRCMRSFSESWLAVIPGYIKKR